MPQYLNIWDVQVDYFHQSQGGEAVFSSVLVLVQFFFSVIIGIYFLGQLRTQQGNRDAIREDSKKELERYLFERQRLMLQRERGGESVRLKDR